MRKHRIGEGPDLPPACDRCRKKHLKCDFEEPCQGCRRAQAACARPTSVNKGGRPRKILRTTTHCANRYMRRDYENGLVVELSARVSLSRPDFFAHCSNTPPSRVWLGAVSSRASLFLLVPTFEKLLGRSGVYLSTLSGVLAYVHQLDRDLAMPDGAPLPTNLGRPYDVLERWLSRALDLPGTPPHPLLVRARRADEIVDLTLLTEAEATILAVHLALGSHLDENSFPGTPGTYGRWLFCSILPLLPRLLLPGSAGNKNGSLPVEIHACVLISTYYLRAYRGGSLWHILGALARSIQFMGINDDFQPDIRRAGEQLEEAVCLSVGGVPVLKMTSRSDAISIFSTALLHHFDDTAPLPQIDGLPKIPSPGKDRLRCDRLVLAWSRAQLALVLEPGSPTETRRGATEAQLEKAYNIRREARACARRVCADSSIVRGDVRLQVITGLDAPTFYDAIVFLLVDGLSDPSACKDNASICLDSCRRALATSAVKAASSFEATISFFLRCAEIVEIAAVSLG
ncbi:hypothetical protein PYCC9005_003205 [Savitreella phatthalungensis]